MESKLPNSTTGTTKIVPLAFPKGAQKLCALCQKRAFLQCNGCRVTFYCDDTHQREDWDGIHSRICQSLITAGSSILNTFQPTDRNEAQLKKMELIKLCRMVAQNKMCEGKHQGALPAAQYCLRLSAEIHGPSTVQMVPAYLLLADVNLGNEDVLYLERMSHSVRLFLDPGVGNLTVVSGLLSQAEWAVLKSPDCGASVRHQLHRSLGRLHTATGNLDAALFHFANDIYFASEESGPDSTAACSGYFLMAAVFVRQKKMAVARSMYAEVARIWHALLAELVQRFIRKEPEVMLEFDEPQPAEVDSMLRAILDFEHADTRKDPARVALVNHALAMLWFLGRDFSKARGFCCAALLACEARSNHDLSDAVRHLMELMQTDAGHNSFTSQVSSQSH
ncbi:zinc finger MYND domain-containing protein 12 [Synchiropus picturatus]